MNHITMKELPRSERPYEKCLQYGPSVLSDADLLSVLLRTGLPGEPVNELALRLLAMLSDRGGLRALADSSVEELTSCRGIGPVKAVMLQCTAELARRIARADASSRISLKDPATVAAFFMEDMRAEEQEILVAAFFDTRFHLLHHSVIARGTVSGTMITPREIFLEALKYRAVCVILLHNHPSGDPAPSEEDIRLTQRMSETGHLLSIPLIDHIIIGDNQYISLKEQGMILQPE